MSADVLLVFVIAALVLMLVGRRAGRRGGADADPDPDDELILLAEAEARQDSALVRTNEAIQLFHRNLDPGKLRSGNDAYVRFYIAYIHALARTFAEDDGVPLDDILATPLTLEILRLTDATGHGTSSSDILARILTSPEGAEGAAAGRLDGLDACHAASSGPYFQRLRAFFEAPAISDRTRES